MRVDLVAFEKMHRTIKALCGYLGIETQTKKGRKLSLRADYVITLGVLKQLHGIETKKSLYELFELSSHCSYKILVVNLNRFSLEAGKLLAFILHHNQTTSHFIKHTDSTDIPVCLLKNSSKHKVWENLAAFGHSGKGFYYGLKLHLTSDLDRKILTLRFAPADSDDRKVFQEMNKSLFGYFIADAGYVSKRLETDFVIEGKRYVLIRPKWNMRKLATTFQHLLYQTRMKIEHIFQNLKVSYRLITSLPRSITGYLAHYLYSILAYLVS